MYTYIYIPGLFRVAAGCCWLLAAAAASPGGIFEEFLRKNLKKIINITRKAHQIIGCKGVTRSDFKFYKGKFYLLEINTQPGMTKLSLVPEIANYTGISFIKLIEWILKDASINR